MFGFGACELYVANHYLLSGAQGSNEGSLWVLCLGKERVAPMLKDWCGEADQRKFSQDRVQTSTTTWSFPESFCCHCSHNGHHAQYGCDQ